MSDIERSTEAEERTPELHGDSAPDSSAETPELHGDQVNETPELHGDSPPGSPANAADQDVTEGAAFPLDD